MVPAAFRPLQNGFGGAADDLGGPADADAVSLTCHYEIVFLAGQMGVLVSSASTVIEHTSAGLAPVFADGAGLGLIRPVSDDVLLSKHSEMPAFLVRARDIKILLLRSSESHLTHTW